MAVIDTYALVGPLYRRPDGVDFSAGLDSLSPVDTSPPVVPYDRATDRYGAVADNTPISEVGEAYSSWRGPSFLDDYYYRVHVRPGSIVLGNLLSSQTREVEVWNAHFAGKLLSSITDVGLDGIDLAEPVPAPTTFASLESRIYVLSISTNGAPVIDGEYEFHFPDETPALRITGRRVVVWPFVPQTKFREQLQWLTDVMQAYSAEQRLALRAAPRQTLQYDFQLDQQQYSRAKAISTQWAHRVYGAPVWAEATRVGALSAGAASIAFDTTNADYRANDIVLVWESDEEFVAAETTTLTAGGVTLKLPLDRSYSNAFVMPLRFARTLQGTEFSRIAHTVTRARLAFLVNNNVDLGASISLPQYRGKDVMTDRSVVLSDMSEKIVRAVDVFDNGSGPVTIDQERAYPDRTEVLSMDPQNRAEVWRMRKWLHARRGKQRTFWLPGWNADLILLENVGSAASSITVRPIGYPLYYGTQDIMVQLNSGTQLFNRVLSASTGVSGNEVLTMSGPFGVAFNVSDVSFICFMKHVRLDTDNADINHDYAGRASCSVAVVEVPEGDLSVTYATYESSVQQGAPVELYEFVQGLSRWNYISGADQLVRLGQTYKPSNIKRDRVKQSTDIFKNGMKLTFPRDDEFASQFLGFAPEEITTVTIMRGHWGDPDGEYVVYWKGRVLSAKATDSQVELECEPVYTSIRRPGLRAKFEYGCRHVLYARGCGVNRELYRHKNTVLTLTGGLNVEVAGVAGIYADGWFTGGILVAPDNSSRFIVGHASGVVTLSRPLASLATGQTVKLYPGCDHLRTTCDTKFNNLDNFGGFPWIPSRNPFDGSSIV